MTSLGDKMVFASLTSVQEGGSTVWITDGTSESTTELQSYSSPEGLANNSTVPNISNSRKLDDKVVYNYGAVCCGELWASDGTAVGSERLALVHSKNSFSFGGRLFFTGTDGSRPQRPGTLWSTDGTAENSNEVTAPRPDEGVPYNVYDFTPFAGSLYFLGNLGGQPHVRVWSTDGTDAGTVQVSDVLTGNVSIEILGSTSDYLYFSGPGPGGIKRFWQLNASGKTTSLDVLPGNMPFDSISRGGMINNKLVFTVTADVTGTELWVSDGSSGGTFELADINPGAASSDPRDFIVFDDALYFVATNIDRGSELWRTDGAISGTELALNVQDNIGNPDARESLIHVAGELVLHKDELHFVGTSVDGGEEIWRYNGTTLNQVTETLPGTQSADPQQLLSAENRLFFTANNGVTGREPWIIANSTLSLSAPTEVEIGQSTQLTWVSSETQTCQASNGWTGDRPVQGMELIGPIAVDTTFELNCTGFGGDVSRSVTVNAVPPADDMDLDGLSDAWETLFFGNLDALPEEDQDSDLASNAQEQTAGTDPTDSDSDDDGLSDGDEISRGTNPLDTDTDSDGATDFDEVTAGSDPNDSGSTPAPPAPPAPPTPPAPPVETSSGSGSVALFTLLFLIGLLLGRTAGRYLPLRLKVLFQT